MSTFCKIIHHPGNFSKHWFSETNKGVMISSLVTTLFLLIAVNHTISWALIPQFKIQKYRLSFYSTTTTTTTTTTSFASKATEDFVLGGVSEFEKWFGSIKGAKILPSIRHDAFGLLRGLSSSWEDPSTTPNSSESITIITLPKDIVLSARYEDENWDANLAMQLGEECQKGSQSFMYG
jgi:hypothetical protein